MTKENYLFINDIPLLFKNKSIAKQLEIEVWLGLEIEAKEKLTQITKLRLEKPDKEKVKYIV